MKKMSPTVLIIFAYRVFVVCDYCVFQISKVWEIFKEYYLKKNSSFAQKITNNNTCILIPLRVFQQSVMKFFSFAFKRFL